MSTNFMPPRVPLVDPNTGLITREWYQLLQTLFTFGSGVSDGEGNLLAPISSGGDELMSALNVVASEAALSPAPNPIFVTLDDVLPVINSLREEIAILRGQIDDVRKGTVSL